jgi:transposase
VRRTYEPGMTVSLVARQTGVAASLLFQWRKLERQGALTAVSAGEAVVPASELAAARAEIAKLQRVLGKKTLENEILKEAVEYAAEKSGLRAHPCCPRTTTSEGRLPGAGAGALAHPCVEAAARIMAQNLTERGGRLIKKEKGRYAPLLVCGGTRTCSCPLLRALLKSPMKTLKQVAALATFLLAPLLSAAGPAPGVGDIPPPEAGTTLDGDPVRLADYTGKAIVVSFWATWCPYCLKELPILEGIQSTAGKDRIQVIALNTEDRAVFRRAARTLSSLKLLVAHDTGKKGSEAYGVKGIPHMVIIGRDGRILKIYRGYDESQLDSIVADINRALADPTPSWAAPAP